MTDHIILTAFGTTARAKITYEYLDGIIAHHFPDHQRHWYFSSPTVRRALSSQEKKPAKALSDIVSEVVSSGSSSIIVQSLHVLPGKEFHRVIREVLEANAPARLGLPLLCSPDDFRRVARCLIRVIESSGTEAALILGHGTAHPSWTAFETLENELKTQSTTPLFVTALEKFPDTREMVIDRICASGYRNILVIPFLMVAGMHFQRDITGPAPTTWKSLLAGRDIELKVFDRGLGTVPGIAELFCDHIKDASSLNNMW